MLKTQSQGILTPPKRTVEKHTLRERINRCGGLASGFINCSLTELTTSQAKKGKSIQRLPNNLGRTCKPTRSLLPLPNSGRSEEESLTVVRSRPVAPNGTSGSLIIIIFKKSCYGVVWALMFDPEREEIAAAWVPVSPPFKSRAVSATRLHSALPAKELQEQKYFYSVTGHYIGRACAAKKKACFTWDRLAEVHCAEASHTDFCCEAERFSRAKRIRSMQLFSSGSHKILDARSKSGYSTQGGFSSQWFQLMMYSVVPLPDILLISRSLWVSDLLLFLSKRQWKGG